ncbi:filamentous hemagglutinin N-terminal domain-containing protein [Pararobbsia alpina]|uniref:filamentous hemagglutinin N-terminal domain-containing protein n=1 Tax=Pararobbsia alpina TaxID=621374 RepID=UPI0015814F5E|nr:filamentous hemagglutinin N-terminal domain-containing protein [Pararobbsia alpina]
MHAQIVPDTTFSGRPTISEASNGVPVIAINSPSSAGVSFNAYEAFGVGEGGVVFNNSTRPVGTELAYNISRNPKLGEQAARIIVSEVNGSQPSVLSGKIEVAGARADVVIANPNGIVCSGCGFISTDRVVLTTGHRVDSGDIEMDAFNVTRGEINIERLVAPDLAQLDLIGRKVKINGELRAMDVRVISGGNRIRYLSKQERADGAEEVEMIFIGKGKRQPNGIDVATLGGIHANKIRLLSTENGIGVRVAGKLASSAGDLEIVSADSLNMEGSLSSSGALVIRAGSSAKVGPPPASVAANGSGDAGGSQVAGGDGTGGLHVVGEGVGTGGSQVTGGGVGAGGSQVAGGGVGAGESQVADGGGGTGGSPVTGGSAGAGGSQVSGGSVEAGVQAAGGGVGTDESQVSAGGVEAGGSPAAGGGVGTDESQVSAGDVEAGGSQAIGGDAGGGESQVASGGVGTGGSQVADGGAEASGSPMVGAGSGAEGPPVAGGGAEGAIPPQGRGEAGHLAKAPAEIVSVLPSSAMPNERMQAAIAASESASTLIQHFSQIQWLPTGLSSLLQYLTHVGAITAKTRQSSANAGLFTLPRTAPGTTIARVDESFRQQRIASEQLLPERRRRSYDASDFEHGHDVILHGVFSSSAAGHVNHLTWPVTAGSPS